MFCRHCGAEVEGNPANCPSCGGDITPLATYANTSADSYRYPGDVPQDFHYPEEPAANFAPQPPKRKRWPLIAGLAAGVVVVLAVVIVLIVSLSGKGGAEVRKSVINARISDDGTAYIPLMDGTCVTIGDDVKSAALTADRTHIVVLLTDGTLYVTDPQLSEKTTIADEAAKFSNIRDDGFFYEDEEECSYRVLFQDGEPLELGHDVAFIVADNTCSVLYATDDGDIFSLAAGSDERGRVGTFDKSTSMEGISDDGQICVWVNSDGEERTIYFHDGQDRITLGTVTCKYNYTYVTFTEDQQMATVVNSYCDTMWILNRDQEPVKVKLGAEPDVSTVYTSKGYLSRSTAQQAQYLYMLTEADNGANVYCITPDGDRERVLSRVLSMSTAGDHIFYLDTDNNLRCGKLEGASITEETKLAGDVDMFEVSSNGAYVYYIKGVDEDNDTGSMYCAKLGTEGSEKIDSDVYCYYFSASLAFMQIDISTDGATVYYGTDPEKVGDTSTRQCTMMMWSYGSEDPVRIASDALISSTNSGYSTGEVNPDALIYLKVSYSNPDKDIFGNWMFYNGKESQRMASDVKY